MLLLFGVNISPHVLHFAEILPTVFSSLQHNIWGWRYNMIVLKQIYLRVLWSHSTYHSACLSHFVTASYLWTATGSINGQTWATCKRWSSGSTRIAIHWEHTVVSAISQGCHSTPGFPAWDNVTSSYQLRLTNLRAGPILAATIHSLLRSCAKLLLLSCQNFIYKVKQKQSLISG